TFGSEPMSGLFPGTKQGASCSRRRFPADLDGGAGALPARRSRVSIRNNRDVMATDVVSGTEDVDGIPVRWMEPTNEAGVGGWVRHLAGSTEQTKPMLRRLAARGLLAVSFDPPDHGRRFAGSERRELVRDVLGSFRRRMWPLLGLTVLECVRVLDWV